MFRLKLSHKKKFNHRYKSSNKTKFMKDSCTQAKSKISHLESLKLIKVFLIKKNKIYMIVSRQLFFKKKNKKLLFTNRILDNQI